MVKRPPIDELNKAIYAVYFDQINGVAGTDYPIGTAAMPVNNLTDAKVIATSRKTSTIILVHGVITLDGDISGYNFIGNKFSDPSNDLLENTIELNGFTASNCTFEGIIIDNDAGGALSACGCFKDCALVQADTIDNCDHFFNCASIFADLTECNYFINCALIYGAMTNCSVFFNCGTITGAFTACRDFYSCDRINGNKTSCSGFYSCGQIAGTMTECTDIFDCGAVWGDFDCTALVFNPEMQFNHGGIFITNLTDARTLTIAGDSLIVAIDPSCTAGTVKVYGSCKITGKEAAIAAGVTVEDYTNRPNDEVPVNIMAVTAPGATVFDLSTADTHYTVDKLRLKADDPGADTIEIELWELVNGVLTLVRSFTINTGNYTWYFSLVDMFSLDHLAGDNLKVVARTSANTYAVTGSYCYRSS